MDKIGIIGLGVVGSAILKFYVRHLPQLWLYDKYRGIGSLNYVSSNTNIIYVAVPTPYKPGVGYDLTELSAVLEQLHTDFKSRRKMCVVLIKSTVLPGTCDRYAKQYPYLNIIYNPEFLSNNTAYKDFCKPKQVILGKTLLSSTKVYHSVIRLFKRYWPDAQISKTSAINAECTKIFCNNFYAVKIQFCNELWFLTKSLQANEGWKCDYKEIMRMMIANGWINPMHTRVPGTDGLLSYGGGCFPKDTQALLEMMRDYSPYYGVLDATVEEHDNIR